VGSSDVELLKANRKKSPSPSSVTNKGNEASASTEEAKEAANEDLLNQDIPESATTQGHLLTHLLELLDNSTNHKTCEEKIGDKYNSLESLESRLVNTSAELESMKGLLKDAKNQLKQKSKALEEAEEKVEKLSQRIDACPWTPYALTQKHHFNQQAGPHECLCIVCGEKIVTLRNHSDVLYLPHLFRLLSPNPWR
jgi:chromosome segregation ATPase